MILRLALLVTVLLVMLAAPAAAHGRGSDATNFRSQITATPGVEGLEWQVLGGDELLHVRNGGDQEVVVLGYEGEPYLRVGPDGVFENRNSPATYLNRERLLTSVPPGVEADPEAAPEWEQVSDGNSYAWHDHRIHWMAPTPAVADPGSEELVFEWAVPFRYGDDEHNLLGALHWVPGPSVWPWLGLGLLVVLPALAGWRSEPDDDDRWPRLARPAAAVLGVVLLLNVSHLVDDFVAMPLPFSVRAYAAVQTILFLGIGVFGVVRAWQASDVAFTALGVGAGAVFIGQGLLYLPVLGASQVASVFPEWLARLTIAASLVQVVPLGAVAFRGTRALVPEAEAGSQEAEH